MKRLIEERQSLVESVDSAAASNFFKKGIMPDGEKWSGGSPGLFFKAVNEPVVTREKKSGEDEISYSARYLFTPGKGGGGGISLDPRASNHFFNLAGTDKKQIAGFQKAIGAAANGSKRGLNSSVLNWFKNPDNLIWRVVGWDNRKKYAISDIRFKGIDYKPAMIDPTRRKWPAGRTEAWIPVTVDVMATLRRKQ